MKLVFATHNQNKFQEVKNLVPTSVELVSLQDIGCYSEIPETGKTLEENAKIKADFVTSTYGLPCFSDDTGLLVNALKGAPGVYSARYAGPDKDANSNMDKLLQELNAIGDRSARFETVIALNLNSECHFFKGVVHGNITKEKKGKKGFGYDPVFRPKGYDKTFAELPMEEKNGISHRAKAVKQLVDFLASLPNS
ncbi:non-canonical purine NTP diphosphatase [Flavobacteriaceae bacterium GF1]